MNKKKGERSRLESLFREMAKKKICYLFLIPSFAFLITFVYYPALSAFFHSFFRWNGFNIKVFIGFRNFITIWHDPTMHISALNIIKLTIASVIIIVSSPLLAAELIFHLRNLRAAYFYRVLFVIPMVVPWMVTFLFWKFIYNPEVGLLNQLLSVLGLGDLTQVWLGDYKLALYCIIFAGFPWVSGFAFSGFALLVYLAGLLNIPPAVLDAGKIDGATGFIRIWRIELPLITSQIKLMIIWTLIIVIQDFIKVMILTGGGPGDSTMVPGLHMYNNAFTYSKMGYGCAIGTVLFFIILTLTIINIKYIKSSVEYETT